MKLSEIAECPSLSEIKSDLLRYLRFFTHHPHKNGKTYLGHLVHAWRLSFEMARGSAALLIHGVFPGWFEHTGSTVISSLYHSIYPSVDSTPSESPSLIPSAILEKQA